MVGTASSNRSYSPQTYAITVGDTVVWYNTTVNDHSVASDGPFPRMLNSGNVRQGETWSFTFISTGVFPYHCIFHSVMQGTITVNPPTPSPSPEPSPSITPEPSITASPAELTP
jgi:plastocyanin